LVSSSFSFSTELACVSFSFFALTKFAWVFSSFSWI
jgi:hypothetical protein